jgi:hypothetical protein
MVWYVRVCGLQTCLKLSIRFIHSEMETEAERGLPEDCGHGDAAGVDAVQRGVTLIHRVHAIVLVQHQPHRTCTLLRSSDTPQAESEVRQEAGWIWEQQGARAEDRHAPHSTSVNAVSLAYGSFLRWRSICGYLRQSRKRTERAQRVRLFLHDPVAHACTISSA